MPPFRGPARGAGADWVEVDGETEGMGPLTRGVLYMSSHQTNAEACITPAHGCAPLWNGVREEVRVQKRTREREREREGGHFAASGAGAEGGAHVSDVARDEGGPVSYETKQGIASTALAPALFISLVQLSLDVLLGSLLLLLVSAANGVRVTGGRSREDRHR